MSSYETRRLRAFATMLKLEHHELRMESASLADRLRELGLHEAAVDSAMEELQSTEARARQLLHEDEFLPVDALADLLRYMPDVRKELRNAEAVRVRGEAAVTQAHRTVAQRKARVRGVERVHGRLSAEHKLDIERDLSRQIDELWLYRRSSRS